MPIELITKEHGGGLLEKSRAVFSRCERHRVELRREWSPSGPTSNLFMPNPSTVF